MQLPSRERVLSLLSDDETIENAAYCAGEFVRRVKENGDSPMPAGASGYGQAADTIQVVVNEWRELRVAAIEREYAAKLEDLRHNYALSVTIEWVQALELFVPVQRFSALVRRRKGERLVRLDWHPVARLMEPPLCDWRAGIERTRLVCDEKLHLTEPALALRAARPGAAPAPPQPARAADSRSSGRPLCRAPL